MKPQHVILRSILTVLLGFSWLCGQLQAQDFPSKAIYPAVFVNDHLQMLGIKVYVDQPLRFGFLMDLGLEGSSQMAKPSAQRMIRYFFTALAVPEDQVWVNLSPTEPDRIIPDALKDTEMGQVMLAQDRILKQVTASLLNPQSETGRKFWDQWNALDEDKEIQGLLHKVWITPETATVVVKGGQAFVVASRLKVMEEAEYLAGKEERGQVSSPSRNLIRQLIIPAIEREVNESRQFAPLRQVYQAMILATWYKRNFKSGFLKTTYVNQSKLNGLNVADARRIQLIYDDYVQAFRDGAYAVMMEEYDPAQSQMVVKNYFSGGIQNKNLPAVLNQSGDEGALRAMLQKAQTPVVYDVGVDAAMTAGASDIETFQYSETPVVRKPIHQSEDLTIVVSLMDIGFEEDADGRWTYRGSFEKAKDIMKQLAADGVGQVYLNGLYEPSPGSMPLHQVETDGEHLIRLDNDTCFVKIANYKTKRERLNPGERERRDENGNIFSILSLNQANPKYHKEGEDARAVVQALTAYAASLGLKVTFDFIPWLAPEAINKTNLSWTHHRPLNRDEMELFRQWQNSKDENAILEILRRNDHYYLRVIDGEPFLIEHFYGGQNKDQVYLNAFLPDVQEYYIEAAKNLIDLGASSLRADLAPYLLHNNLQGSFQDWADRSEEEPWFHIMKAVAEYADQQGKSFTWIMESYNTDEIRALELIAQRAEANVMFYPEEKSFKEGNIYKNYLRVIRHDAPVERFVVEVNKVIDAARRFNKNRIGHITNYDELPLKSIGGPIEAMVKLQILLAYLGVPQMIDLRDWMLHSGHMIPPPGGMDAETGEITHPWPSMSEEAQRKSKGVLKILEELRWNEFIQVIQEINRKGAELIVQERDGQPWYFLNYVDQGQARDFVTIGWKTGENLNMFVVDFRPNAGTKTVKVKIPSGFGKSGQESVEIPMDFSQSYRLVTLKPNGELVAHDAAMVADQVKSTGGVNFDAKYLDLKQDGVSEIEEQTPGHLKDISSNDVEGIVPVILDVEAWAHAQWQE